MEKAIVLADSYLESYEQLSNRERRMIREKLKQFAREEKTGGFSIHPLDRTKCDRSFKSARINRDLRLIFSQQGKKYILLYVGHHDDAYKWVEGKYLSRNSFGAVYLHDTKLKIKEYSRSLPRDAYYQQANNRQSLLKKRGVGLEDLKKLDIDEEIAGYLLKIKDEDVLIRFISILPQEIQEGLIDIVIGVKDVEQVYNELQDKSVNGQDNNSIEVGLSHKNSKRRFYLVEDQEELEYILDKDIEQWKLFLHPRQEALVKKHFNGPALVEGGPGTGKTVVGIHRAVYLARQVYRGEDNRILFCTFSKKLAYYIKNKVRQLALQKKAPDNIEVKSVDSLFYQLVNQYNLTSKQLRISQLNELFENTYLEMDLDKSLNYYKTEYREVIQRYQIKTLDQYLQTLRIGREKSLPSEARAKDWAFFEKFLQRKEERCLMDFEDLAFILFRAIQEGRIPPLYDSIIIDEAQDLSPIKIKVFSGLVKDQPNNLFLLSDKNQRIYEFRSWKQDVGINVVGRTHYLTLNYRTTKQIREYADRQFVHTSLDAEYLREYKSIYWGPEPVLKQFSSTQEQYRYIVSLLHDLLERGIRAHEIAVISPIDREKISGILEYEGIKNTVLKKSIYPSEGCGVGITTLHGSKGLEFKVVIIANFNLIDKQLKEEISDRWYSQNITRQIECLKYVACTRARDELIVTMVE